MSRSSWRNEIVVSQGDLGRAALEDAHAVFIIPNKVRVVIVSFGLSLYHPLGMLATAMICDCDCVCSL